MFSELADARLAARMFKSLGNPYRLLIISLLLGGEMNVTQLNKNLKLSQPALSQHLSILRGEGLLGARREQRQVYYSISNAAMTDLIELSHRLIAFKANGKKERANA